MSPDRPTGRSTSNSSARKRKARSSTRWTCRSRRSRRRPACPASSSSGPPISIACCRWKNSPTNRDDDPLETGMPEDPAAEVARQAAELQILQRVAGEVNATLDLEEVYDIALGTMGELFEAHHAIILLLEPDGQTLRVVASRG